MMKYLTVGAIAAVSILSLACTRGSAPQPTESATPMSVISSPTAVTAQQPATAQQPEISASGQFVAAEHPTLGMASIVTENGKRYLVFDQAFKTDSGPDLFVLLHQEKNPQTYDAQNYLSLGGLQNTSGEQRYAIPDQVDVAQFQSVVIWCRQFNATFGYAPFAQ